MPISTECPECGKRLKAPDTAAGRRAKCPQCGAPIPIPEAVYDAEEVFEAEESYDEDEGGSYGLEIPPPPAPRRADTEDRRPCPVCGEMIKATAVKCRYCGEVFDATLRRAGHGGVDPDKIRRFRREMHGLGGFWIFIGCIGLLVAAGVASFRQRAGDGVLPAVFIVPALLYFVLGIFVFMKHLWAVWTGLVFAYISLVLNIANVIRVILVLAAAGANVPAPAWGFFMCIMVFAFAILAAVIVQSHRVIKWAGELKRAGVPLTATA